MERRIVIIISLLTLSATVFAESAVIADIREKNRLRKFDPNIPFEERKNEIIAIDNRIKPVIQKEVDNIIRGEITTLTHELLNDREATTITIGILLDQLKSHPTSFQTATLEKVFGRTADSLRGYLLISCMLKSPREVLENQPIQDWLVEKINAGLPAGAFYFILTDDSAEAVSKTAKASMKRFSKRNGKEDDNLFSLVSAVFLASRGDKDAIRLLDSLLEKRDLDSMLDTAYVIQAAAMSGNEKLIQKIVSIITTDNRSRWYGDDVLPSEASFAHVAASACSLTIEGFPNIRFWQNYEDAVKNEVHEWLKSNPSYKIKHDNELAFFKDTPFETIIPEMIRRWK